MPEHLERTQARQQSLALKALAYEDILQSTAEMLNFLEVFLATCAYDASQHLGAVCLSLSHTREAIEKVLEDA